MKSKAVFKVIVATFATLLGASSLFAQDRVSVSFNSEVTGSTGAVSTPAAGWTTASGTSGTVTATGILMPIRRQKRP